MEVISIKDIIVSASALVSILTALLALHRSSRQKNDDAIKTIGETLSNHINTEESRISKMEVSLEYIIKSADKLEEKLDKIQFGK